MESPTDGFALFGPGGTMVFCNTISRRINENPDWLFDGGVTFDKIVRANMNLGLLECAMGREEAFLTKRMARHRSALGEPGLMCWTDGNVLLIRERLLDNGKIRIVNTGITKLSRHEKALTKALDATEQASWAKSAFLARMSHRFQTPLNAIIGFPIWCCLGNLARSARSAIVPISVT